MVLGDFMFTHKALSILQVIDGCVPVIISFQRAGLEVHTAYGWVFQLHKSEPVDLNSHIRYRQVLLYLMYQVDMCLYQVPGRRRQPSIQPPAVAETGLGIPDDLTGNKRISCILGQLPHPHTCLDHCPVLFRQPLPCLTLPVPGSPAALAAFLHQLCDLLIPGLHGCR